MQTNNNKKKRAKEKASIVPRWLKAEQQICADRDSTYTIIGFMICKTDYSNVI